LIKICIEVKGKMKKHYLTAILCTLAIVATASIAMAQGSGTVLLVSDNEADSAIAEAIKNVRNLEIVTTPWNEFDEAVVLKIKELDPRKIYIIGGPVAVVPDYETQLDFATIIRISGKDRYATAAATLEQFQADFKGKGIIVVNGHDIPGIVKAKIKAKNTGAILLYIKAEGIPEEVEDALDLSGDEEIEIISSPDMDVDEIDRKIKLRARLHVKPVDRLNETARRERALEQINRTRGMIESAELAIEEHNATEVALKLLKEAEEHFANAEEAFENGNYGRAFGQAVAAANLAKNAIRAAEHEGEGKSRPEAAKEAIRSAQHAIEKAEEELSELSYPAPAAERMLDEAKEHLEIAEEAYKSDEFGSAYAHAKVAKRLGQNALEIAKHERKKTHITLTLKQKRNGRDRLIGDDDHEETDENADHDAEDEDEEESDEEEHEETSTTTTLEPITATSTTSTLTSTTNPEDEPTTTSLEAKTTTTEFKTTTTSSSTTTTEQAIDVVVP
jgi:putative cell wall-binding protein